MQRSIELRTDFDIPLASLLALYTSVGWVAYTSEERREDLKKAVANSSFVVSAWDGDALIGLARVLSDDVAIAYLQDILVHSDYQRTGIGSRLLEACLSQYAHVRAKVLLTDDAQRQHDFYEKAGFRNIRDLAATTLNTFALMEGVD